MSAKTKQLMECREFFENLGQGAIVIGAQGEILEINALAKKLLGYNKNGIHGKDWIKVLKPEILKEYNFLKEAKKIHLKSTVKRKLTTKFFSLKKKNGQKFPAIINLSPVKNLKPKKNSNRPAFRGAIIMFTDNTHDHEVMQSKNELISLASHQMRTPLTTLRWYLEMLIDGSVGKVDREAKEFLSEAKSVNDEMMELIEGLLNISRFELGTFVVDPSKIDVTESANFMIKQLQPSAREKSLKIETKYPKIPQRIKVDKKLLEIIFQNLLSNAVKYTPKQGVISLKIDILEKGKNFHGTKLSKDSLIIEVKDNGLGIPKKDQKKIFTRLFRAENAITNGFEGTGLGLYMVKAIVENFSGEIKFKSQENHGCHFFLYLPLENLKQSTKK